MLLTLAVGVEGFALIFAMRRQRACVRRQATVDQPGRLAPSPLADASPARRACTKVCWCNRRPQESQGAANGGRKCGRASAPRRLGHAGPHLPTFLSAPAQARTPRPAQQSSTEYLQVEGMDDEPSFMSSHVVPLLCRCATFWVGRWERGGGGGGFFLHPGSAQSCTFQSAAHTAQPAPPQREISPAASCASSVRGCVVRGAGRRRRCSQRGRSASTGLSPSAAHFYKRPARPLSPPLPLSRPAQAPTAR